jgi:hypothetical protein
VAPRHLARAPRRLGSPPERSAGALRPGARPQPARTGPTSRCSATTSETPPRCTARPRALPRFHEVAVADLARLARWGGARPRSEMPHPGLAPRPEPRFAWLPGDVELMHHYDAIAGQGPGRGLPPSCGAHPRRERGLPLRAPVAAPRCGDRAGALGISIAPRALAAERQAPLREGLPPLRARSARGGSSRSGARGRARARKNRGTALDAEVILVPRRGAVGGRPLEPSNGSARARRRSEVRARLKAARSGGQPPGAPGAGGGPPAPAPRRRTPSRRIARSTRLAERGARGDHRAVDAVPRASPQDAEPSWCARDPHPPAPGSPRRWPTRARLLPRREAAASSRADRDSTAPRRRERHERRRRPGSTPALHSRRARRLLRTARWRAGSVWKGAGGGSGRPVPRAARREEPDPGARAMRATVRTALEPVEPVPPRTRSRTRPGSPPPAHYGAQISPPIW